jgi:hypothetical protein
MGSIYSTTRQQPPRRRRFAFRHPKENGTTPGKHVKRNEESVQMRIATYIKRTYPHAVFICDYAAGFDMTDNQRMKMMHMRSDEGMSDLHIFTPSRGFHGLIIEIKQEGVVVYKKDGTLRKSGYKRRMKNGQIKIGDHLQEQAAYLLKMNSLGWVGRFGIGYDKCKILIDWYFENEQSTLPF